MIITVNPSQMSRKNTPQDIWKFVEKTENCWIWVGAKNRKGYGQFRLVGKLWIAHRLSYSLSSGAIPEGMSVLHRCDTPSCVRPEHLFLGTNQENVDDKMAKRRHWVFSKNTCSKGHALEEGNVRIRPDGARACRECERNQCRKYYDRHLRHNPEKLKARVDQNRRARNERLRKKNSDGLLS